METKMRTEKEIYETFRKRFKEKRIERGLTFEELEKLTGVKKSCIQRYETGGTGKIPLDAVIKLEYILGVTPGYLCGLDLS